VEEDGDEEATENARAIARARGGGGGGGEGGAKGEGGGDKVGDECSIGDDRVTFAGVCGQDASGSTNGVLGCVTSTGARFLRYLTRGLSTSAFPEIPATFSVANVADDASVSAGVGWGTAVDVVFRRHGSASLCAGVDALSQKLPIHLKLAGLQAGGAGLVLSTGASSDPSMLRARAAEHVMRFMGVPTPRTAFVRVYFNGDYLGLYVAEEELSAALMAQRFVEGHVPNDAVTALINGWQPKDKHFVATVRDEWVPEGDSEDEAIQLKVTTGQHVFVTQMAPPWFMVTDADGASGWVPEDRLEDLKCKDTIGTLYEPKVKFDTSSFRPFEWVPTDGAERRPLWKDLSVLHSAIHSGMRARDRDSWRQMLESVFDVEMFLTATAVQVAIGNGDTYGRIPHNFMLYGPPCSSQPLVWAPYDLDASWMKPGGEYSVLPLPADPLDSEYSKGGLLESWSLLTYVMAEPEFRDRYYTRLQTAITMLRDGSTAEQLRQWQAMITPYLDPDSTKGENAEITKIDFNGFEQECEGLGIAVRERTDMLYKKLPGIKDNLADAVHREDELASDRTRNNNPSINGDEVDVGEQGKAGEKEGGAKKKQQKKQQKKSTGEKNAKKKKKAKKKKATKKKKAKKTKKKTNAADQAGGEAAESAHEEL